MKKKEVENLSAQQQIEELLRSTKRDGVENLIEYLDKSDFYISPASSRYHGAYEGGLAEHSLNVLECFLELEKFYKRAKYNVPKLSKENIIIVSLLHDLCKINTYKLDKRNVKIDGVWQEVPYYKREPLLPMGHAGKSIFIIQQFINLTVEEGQAIFWHMGAYDTSTYNTWNELSDAWRTNFLGYVLHQADMNANYITENEIYQQP